MYNNTDDEERAKARELSEPPVEILEVDRMEEQQKNGQIMQNYCDEVIDEQCTTDTEVQPLTEKQLPFLRRCFILEVPMFLIYFAINLSSSVYQNQLLFQTCKVVFHYNETTCEPMLGATTNNNFSKEVENIVQPYVSRISMAGTLIQSIIPAVLSLFIGPWSDKFGRRPIMITTLLGSVVGYVISCIIAAISLHSDVDPWLYIIGYVPSAICGGNCVFMVMTYCYIADVAPGPTKALRMVLNDAALGVGVVIGSVVSSHLFIATNMATVYGISGIATLLALIYICLVNEESIQVQECSLGQKLHDFFHYKLVWQLIRTCTAKRNHYRRAFLWCTMIALIITNFVTQGESDIVYLFFRKKFDITINEYSTFNGISNGIQIIGGILGITILRKILQISIVSMSLITLISAVAQSITRAAAQLFWQVYLGAGLGCLSGIISAMLLTVMAFITPAHETGAVFALTTALQTVSPLGAAPMYTEIYNSTLTYYPGLFNIVSAILYFICCVGMSVMYVVQRMKHCEIQRPTDFDIKDSQVA